MEIRVQIFSDYATCTDHKNAFRSWNHGKTEYKNMQIVDDDNYTHAVIYNLGTPKLKVPKENVIAFSHEPFEILYPNLDYVKDNIGTYICHDKTKFPNWPCFKEYICYLPPGLPIGEVPGYPTEKRHRMSIMASYKQMFEGHRLRHQIIQRILQTNMDIHIWGRGSQHLYRDSRVKGETEVKHVGFSPYEYTISIENVSYKYWVTEKYYDPILVDCIPLYWGAEGVESVFGSDSHIRLPRDIDGIMNIIVDVYHNPQKYRRNTSIVKSALLGDKNYAHFLWSHFNHD